MDNRHLTLGAGELNDRLRFSVGICKRAAKELRASVFACPEEYVDSLFSYQFFLLRPTVKGVQYC